MTDQRTLFRGVSFAAWGYLFLYLNIHMGPINVMPTFVGYLLFLGAIKRMQGVTGDTGMLRSMGLLMVVYYAVLWVCACVGINLDGAIFAVVQLVVGLLAMYFNFRLLTNFAEVAKRYQGEGDQFDARFLRWRNLQTILLAVMMITDLPILPFTGDAWAFLLLIIAGCGIFTCIALTVAMFSFRSVFAETEE